MSSTLSSTLSATLHPSQDLQLAQVVTAKATTTGTNGEADSKRGAPFSSKTQFLTTSTGYLGEQALGHLRAFSSRMPSATEEEVESLVEAPDRKEERVAHARGSDTKNSTAEQKPFDEKK